MVNTEKKIFNRIQVETFGDFSIKNGDISIGDYENRSHKVWALIEFLIINRGFCVEQDKIYDILWNDYELSDQPANALKNLVYRARKSLDDLNIGHETIIFERNTYSFNKNIDIIVDCEEFERIIRLADSTENETQKVELLYTALKLYKGGFLQKSSKMMWVTAKNIYYMNLYVKCVKDICELLFKKENYSQVVNICEMAVMFYPLDETLNYELLKGYIKNKENAKALTYYTKISELFYSELGVSVSDEIKLLYKDIIHSVNKVEMDISIINDDLQEAYCENSAYFCDYEVFKNIYRVQARSILRTNQTIHLALVTVTTRPIVGEMPVNVKFVMSKLKRTILQSLRKGDTVAPYSPVQFVMLLPLSSKASCEAITSRITENFRRLYRKNNVVVNITTRSVTPNESLV